MMTNTQNKRYGVTLLIVLALMVMFAMLVVAFMVIVSQQRQRAEFNAQFLIEPPGVSWVGGGGTVQLNVAFQRLLTGSSDLNNVIAPHSILENLYGYPRAAPFSGTGAGYDPSVSPSALNIALLALADGEGKPFALRPNILAPDALGNQEFLLHLAPGNNVRMNPDYTAPDYMTMFLAWNDYSRNDTLSRIIPSFHRPQLVRYWQNVGVAFDPSVPDSLTELRKYVLRPLPTDHPDFTGSNPAATVGNLIPFLTEGPWDVDNDGDGIADGIWLDIGLPVITDPDDSNLRYKPLVSFYVIDLDGRINVNTIGNLAQLPPDSIVRGMGMGAAELSSDLLPPNILEQIMIGTSNLTGRYGSDEMPGDVTVPLTDLPGLLRNLHGINLDAHNRGGLVADWFGTFPVEFNALGNRILPAPLVGNDLRNIPYLMNPYPSNTSGDTPFGLSDFESLAHSVIEFEYNRLQHPFRELLGNSYLPSAPALTHPDLRYSLTTLSSDIPATAMHAFPVIDPLGNVIEYETLEDRAVRLDMWYLLPAEVREGRKVNLNRLTLHPLCTDPHPLWNNPPWNCTLCGNVGCPLWDQHWNLAATEEARNWLLEEKFKFAQEVFYLMRVLFHDQIQGTPEERLAQMERLAQWSVNLVDFIDPDDVMTPFIFNIDDPEDCTVLINSLLAGTLSASDFTTPNRMLIWGFEKPEVALTETLAIHDRRVDRRESVLGVTWNQVMRPQGSLFIELYRQGNSERSYSASSLVDSDGTLRLDKRVLDNATGDYIWRLAIGGATKTTAGQFDWNDDDAPEKNALRQLLTPGSGEIRHPQFFQWSNGMPADRHYRPHLGTPERFIWFGDEFPPERPFTPSAMELQQRSFINGINAAEATPAILNPDSFLVIKPPETDLTALGLSPIVSLPPGTETMIATNRVEVEFGNVAGSPISDFTGVNVSEPLPNIQGASLSDGYGMLLGNTASPFDDGTAGRIHPQRGTLACYKTIGLQRLADPNRPHHPISNPYITVDWNMIDLHVMNSRDLLGDEPLTHIDSDSAFYASRQWQWEQAAPSGYANLWDRTLPEGVLTAPSGKAGLGSASSGDTLGQTNYSANQFLHFPWHDAPLMNTGELMLIPASAPGRFGIEFHDSGSNDFYGIHDWLAQTGLENDRPRFGYHHENTNSTFSLYPNWTGEQSANVPSMMARLFDFVHVPSKFAAETRRPDGTVHREPGKINLNTLTEEGWETLANGRATFPNYATFRTTRQWSPLANDPTYPSEFRPFRSTTATNLVPPLNIPGQENDLVGTPTSTTWLSLENSLGNSLIANDADNAYLALENTMRLSDITTTRSNVFAIWITIGYFHVEHFGTYTDLLTEHPGLTHINSAAIFNAVYPDGYVLGAEKGLNDGTVIRHRAFYLIDRSTPVNFSRGIGLEHVRDVIVGEPISL